MADSTVMEVSKMKVVELRKELKARGLPYAGDKAELINRLQAAINQDDTGDINLDSDDIDSDGVLEDEDDKSQTDILDDSAVDTLNEELALAEQPEQPPAVPEPSTKPTRTLKRKITLTETKNPPNESETESVKETVAKKIVLNRAVSITKSDDEKLADNPVPKSNVPESNTVKVKAPEVDPKTRLEMRAKRFGLPIKVTDDERKQARMKRFGQNTGSVSISQDTGSLTENLDKLKKRSERFGQSVSKIMSDIETKERIEKRKAKFGTVK